MSEQGKALLQSDVIEVKREQSKSTKIQDTITSSLNRQNETIDTMKEHKNKLERKFGERNLRIVNYNEEGEKVSKIVADVLQTKFSIDASKIEVAHRTGKTKFVNWHKNLDTLSSGSIISMISSKIFKMKRDSLKDVPYYITEDQTEMDMKKRNDLQPIIEQAKRDGKRWKFRKGELYIDERLYRPPPGDDLRGQQHQASHSVTGYRHNQ